MAEQFRASINPNLLIWARETSGYTLDELASAANVRPEVLSSWESGAAKPTWRQLKAVANKTKRPIAAFYLPNPPPTPRKLRDFRTLRGVVPGHFSPDLLGLIREARSIRNRADELLDETDVPDFAPLPVLTLRQDPTECAASLRKSLGVTLQDQLEWRDEYTALGVWRDVFFSTGVLVIQLSIPTSEARGFSENYERLSLIAVSSKEDPCPRIFTMFHELTHLCIHMAGVSDPRLDIRVTGAHSFVERFCNRVAAEFLIPLDDPTVRERLVAAAPQGQVDVSQLRRLSASLKVSQSAILYRMVEASFISPSEYSRIVDAWKELPAKAPAPAAIPVPVRRIAYVGRPYASLVFTALDRGRISTHDACSFLGIKPRWLDQVRQRTYAGVGNV